MSLVYSLCGDSDFVGLPVRKPLPRRGDRDFTVFTVDLSLHRGQRIRRLSLKAKLSGIQKAKTSTQNKNPFWGALTDKEATDLLLCRDSAFVPGLELPMEVSNELPGFADGCCTVDKGFELFDDAHFEDLETCCKDTLV